MSSKVVVFNSDYDRDFIKENIKKALSYFDLPDFSDKKFLIKPSLLMAQVPEKAITTHPIVMEAIVETLKEKNAKEIYIGDTPGSTLSNITDLYRKTGMEEVSKKTGAKLINLYSAGAITISGNGLVESIPITKFIKEVDYVINVPKLKTHNFMLMTCAIKNLFGLVPGTNKAKMHSLAITPKNFAKILVYICEEVKPLINIVDAIIGMEGEGPSAGNPRRFGKIIVGVDPVAVDTVSSLILGYRPEEIYTNVIAYERGLGEMNLENIEIIGNTTEGLFNKDVKKGKSLHMLADKVPGFVNNIASSLYSRFVKLYPAIEDETCIKCEICANSCPQKAIFLIDNKMIIDYEKCISCFCCHELCPQKAIKLEKNFIAKRIWR